MCSTEIYFDENKEFSYGYPTFFYSHDLDEFYRYKDVNVDRDAFLDYFVNFPKLYNGYLIIDALIEDNGENYPIDKIEFEESNNYYNFTIKLEDYLETMMKMSIIIRIDKNGKVNYFSGRLDDLEDDTYSIQKFFFYYKNTPIIPPVFP